MRVIRFLGWVMVASAALLAAEPTKSAADSKAGKKPRSLFDGVSLEGWKPSDFYKPGAVKVDPSFRDGGGAIVLEAGVFLTGVSSTRGDLPRNNYEVSLEAMKLEGNDFFCGLTFPVRDTACTLVVGGWGGGVVGLSSIDDMDASENETSQGMTFAHERWYRVRVRVTDAKIQAWIDREQIVDLETEGRRIGLRFGEIEASLPLGIATYQTKAALRNIEVRELTADEIRAAK